MKKIKRGEIYYANLCPVVGSEQGGIRPVLILQNDTGNYYSSTTIVAAITSKKPKNKLSTHVSICCKGLTRQSIALLEQIRTIDKSRLCNYIGSIENENMKQIEKAIVISFGFARCVMAAENSML